MVRMVINGLLGCWFGARSFGNAGATNGALLEPLPECEGEPECESEQHESEPKHESEQHEQECESEQNMPECESEHD